MRARRAVLAVVAVWLASAAISGQQPSATSSRRTSIAEPSSASTRASLNQYCVSCHNERLKTGGLMLDTMELGNVPADAAVWEKVVRKIRSGAMPPQGARRPDRATADSIVAWPAEADAEPVRPAGARDGIVALLRELMDRAGK